MAESTVSGPFRSENGFQQLDENGEWVPVTGGGGGGGVTSVVAGSGVSVSSPTGAVTIANTGVTSIIAGSGISVSSPTGAVTISATGGGGSVNSYVMQWGDYLALPAPTEIGQIYDIAIAVAGVESGSIPPITIELPTIGTEFLTLGLITIYGYNPFFSPNFDVTSDNATPEFFFGPDAGIGYGNIRFVYVGLQNVFGNSYHIFQAIFNVTLASSP